MPEEHELIEPVAPASALQEFTATPPALHNFEGDPETIWRLTVYATGAACKDGMDIVNQSFGLVYWFCHEATIDTDDKGTIQAVRTVIMDKTGNAFGFVSEGIYNSLRLLVAAMGPGPYDPPLMVKIVQQQTRKGHRLYSIEPAPKRHPESKAS